MNYFIPFFQNKPIDRKFLVFGILLSLLSTIFSFYATPIVFPDNNENPHENDNLYEQKNWDLSSKSSMILSLENHRENLLFQYIVIGIISDDSPHPFGFTANPILTDDTYRLSIWKIIEDGKVGDIIDPLDKRFNQGSWIISKETTQTIEDIEISNDVITPFFQILHNGLIQDINILENYYDITDNRSKIMDSLKSRNGQLYWSIMHVYNDYTILKIESFGNNVVVGIFGVKDFIIEERAYVIRFQNDYESSVYQGIFTNEIFYNYQSSINSVISQLTSGFD